MNNGILGADHDGIISFTATEFAAVISDNRFSTFADIVRTSNSGDVAACSYIPTCDFPTFDVHDKAGELCHRAVNSVINCSWSYSCHTCFRIQRFHIVARLASVLQQL
ncbi:MAG: hypothetical protein JKX93_15340 [Rhizobiaceae bacterium]|nr:hypothetical protein [Rhizobiaceae bacterium]